MGSLPLPLSSIPGITAGIFQRLAASNPVNGGSKSSLEWRDTIIQYQTPIVDNR